MRKCRFQLGWRATSSPAALWGHTEGWSGKPCGWSHLPRNKASGWGSIFCIPEPCMPESPTELWADLASLFLQGPHPHANPCGRGTASGPAAGHPGHPTCCHPWVSVLEEWEAEGTGWLTQKIVKSPGLST
jgi:hypothetical protein